jgi:hypothetical protein
MKQKNKKLIVRILTFYSGLIIILTMILLIIFLIKNIFKL